MRVAFALVLALFVAACGFQLRGSNIVALPYKTLHVAIPDHSEFGVNLKRAIRATGSTQVLELPEGADAVFTPTGESRDKTVLSFTSAGRVREFQLRYRYSYRVHDLRGIDLIEPVTISLSRDFSFDDAAVLAKEQEEALLWRDIQNDLVQQVLRRLAASRPQRQTATP